MSIGTPTAEQSRVSRDKRRIRHLETQLERVTAELVSSKELADIAASQAAALSALQRQRHDEIEELKEQARAAAARSDDDAIIGKLQRQLMELKGSYHSLARRHQSTRAQLQRSRIALAALEAGVDEQRAATLAIRAECKARVVAAEKALEDAIRGENDVAHIRERVRVAEAAHSEAESRVADAAQRIQDVEAERSRLRADVARLKAEVESLGVDNNRLHRQLLDSTRATSLAAAGGGAGGGAPSKRASSVPDAEVQALREELASANASRAELEGRLRRMEEEREVLDGDMADLRMQLHSVPEPEPSSAAGDVGTKQLRQYYKSEQKRLKATAQHTIASLKALLAKKNEIVARCRQRMDDLLREREKEKAAEAASKEQLAAAAYDENHKAIKQLKTAVHDLRTAPVELGSTAVNAQLLERVEELETNLHERDRAVSELEAELQAVNDQLFQAQERGGEAVSAYEETVMELEALKRVAGSNHVDKLVRTLKEQLALKERKMRRLQDTLAALKDEFVRAEEALAERNARAGAPTGSQSEKSSVLRDVAQAGSGASVAALQRRITSLDRALHEAETEKRILKRKVQPLERALQAATKEKESLLSKLPAIEKAADATATENQSLMRRLDGAERTMATLRSDNAAVKKKLSRLQRHQTSGEEDEGRVKELRRQLAVLEAQNEALKSTVEELGKHRRPLATLPPVRDAKPVPVAPVAGNGSGEGCAVCCGLLLFVGRCVLIDAPCRRFRTF